MAIDSTKDKLFDRQFKICKFLEKYVSDRIWSDPYLECRITTRPSILNHGDPGDSNSAPSEMTDKFADGGSVLQAVDTYKAPFAPLNGVLYGSFEQISLPDDGGPFFVYSIDLDQLPSIKLNATKWINLQDYCNTHIVSFRIHTDDGMCLPRGKMYIRQSDHAETILLAINADVFDTCYNKSQKRLVLDENTGDMVYTDGYDPTEIYITTYMESDTTTKSSGLVVREPDNVIESHDVSGFDIANRDRAGITPVPSGRTFVFWNGKLIVADGDAGYLNKFKPGDMLEYITDKDVVATVMINRNASPSLAIIRDNVTTNYTVVHVPKASNRSKHLITAGMCDIFISPISLTEDALANGASIYTTSRYIRQCDVERLMTERGIHGRFISQMTFNDFCINQDLLDDLARDMGCEEVNGVPQYILKVYVRHHYKKLGLVRDSNYCDWLYSDVMSDLDILRFLTKTQTTESDAEAMWFGSTLFDSFYGKKMVEEISVANATDQTLADSTSASVIANQCSTCKSKCDCGRYCKILEHAGIGSNGTLTSKVCPFHMKKGLKDYIDILGYYNALQIVCQRITVYKVIASKTSYPRVLDIRTDPEEEVKSLPSSTFRTLGHNVPVRVPLAYTDLVVDGTDTIDPSKFYAIVYLNGIKVDADNVEVLAGDGNMSGFQPVRFASTSQPIDYSWCEDSKFLNVKIAEEIEIKEGDYITVELVVTESSDSVGRYEMNFDIKSRYFEPIGYSVSGAYNTDAISEDPIPAGNTPWNTYYWKTTGDSPTEAVISSKSADIIYLNGKHLVPGIDYTPLELLAVEQQGVANGIHPVIQNVSYLEETGNHAELIATNDININVAKGFEVGGVIDWQKDGILWFDGLSLLVVDGQVQYKFIFNNKEIDLSPCGVKNGSPYMVRTTVPNGMLELLNTSYVSQASATAASNADKARLAWLHEFFDTKISDVPYRALLDNEHAIYSTYILSIIKHLVLENNKFHRLDASGNLISSVKNPDSTTFEIYDGTAETEMYLDKETFERQFVELANVKSADVVYLDGGRGITEEDLRYVDVYPIYFNPTLNDREIRRKINYLVQMLLPSDQVRHAEHINV